MICVDDLRTELGCYGIKEIKSPNIDQLAKSGLLFNHHYVQVPTCGSSRYALLTGRRTSESGAYHNGAFTGGKSALKKKTDHAQTFPELFRKNGYKTVSIGKISHTVDGLNYAYNGKGKGDREVPNAWDEIPVDYGKWKYGWGTFFAYANGKHREDKKGYRPVMEFPDCTDNDLPDGLNCELALKQLDKLKDQRFFLAVGFYKPHLPFVAPKKYLDMYKGVKIKPARHGVKGNTGYWHRSGEFYKYQFKMDKSNPLSTKNQIKAKEAYYACVTYVDVLVGKLMKKLKDTGLDKNTIVILWGDHGWFLGDHAMWGKHSPLEKAVKSAFMVRIPGVKPAATNAIVETLDIYPTLIDYCNLKNRKTEYPLGGKSLRPVFNNPRSRGKTAAISYWRGALSARNSRYRIIATKKKDKWSKIELYDHYIDPDETDNIAEKQPKVVEQMLKLLEKDSPELK